ncbi:MAG: EamA family transporter [Bacteroidetes bacterium]|nr:EamA family transporter [Bacteroidota bacterium]
MLWFVLALTSALLSAAAAVTQKKVLFRLDALDFSVLLAQVTLLFTLPLFAMIDYAALDPVALSVLFGKTLLGALAFLCVMQAIKNLELSGALPMMVLTPGLVAVVAFFLIGDALSLSETGGLLLLLVGTYVLEMRPGVSLLHPFTVFATSRKHHFIIAALLLFTVTSVLDRYLLTDLQLRPLSMLAFQNLFHGLWFFLFALVARRRIQPMLHAAHSQWGWLLLIAFFTLGYRFTQIEAVSMAPVALVLAVKRLSVFLAAILGGRLFRERHLPRKAIAIVVLIIGATMVVGL